MKMSQIPIGALAGVVLLPLAAHDPERFNRPMHTNPEAAVLV